MPLHFPGKINLELGTQDGHAILKFEPAVTEWVLTPQEAAELALKLAEVARYLAGIDLVAESGGPH